MFKFYNYENPGPDTAHGMYSQAAFHGSTDLLGGGAGDLAPIRAEYILFSRKITCDNFA